ncbi:MAG: ABC transporter ATP-binding protein [Anaerolineales bacterium]|nr:ABC transporter ATP-binding protein [Anaerolineales bacterium]
MENIIEMTGIVKVFPPNVVALDNVSAGFRRGEIHAIVGENGAGKSTLMKVLYGMEERNAGEIFYSGKPVFYHEPGEAIADGIGMVHQEILLIPEYTVCQNVVLGVEPTHILGVLDDEEARRRVVEKIEEFQSNLQPETLVEDLSVAARQKVEILKLLYRNVSILILDEPTAVLTPQEIPQFFNELRRLRDNGKTILFISHHLDEVVELSDRITVMRKGEVVDTVDAAGTSKRELASMMVGREVIFTSLREEKKPGEVVFSVSGLSYRNPHGHQQLKEISFDVRAGEIVGIAGVEGNGQYELVNTITGLLDASGGSFQVNGTGLTHLPILERRKRISYVSQDRSRMGASRTASIIENTIMSHHRLNRNFTRWKGILLNFKAARQFTENVQERFSVNMGSMDNPFNSLSGGNQQKIILGRELSLDAPFVLLDQPTRGLDVGSIEYVHHQILRMREQGRAVLLLSADLDELFRISDRILVMHRGKIVADHKNEDTTLEEVGIQMLEGAEG